MNVPHEKKMDAQFLPITLANDFQNSFTFRLGSNCVTN